MNEDQVPLTPDEAREIIKMLAEYQTLEGTIDGEELAVKMLNNYAAKLALTLDITLNWYMPFSEDTSRE